MRETAFDVTTSEGIFITLVICDVVLFLFLSLSDAAVFVKYGDVDEGSVRAFVLVGEEGNLLI